MIYSVAPGKGQKGSSKRLHTTSDAAEITRLLSQGWKKSAYPVSESGNDYRDEKARRLDCKWEPLVRRSISKVAKNLNDPFLTLRAIARNQARDRFEYVAVVTLQARKFDGDLYQVIRERYPALAPIRLRTEAETRVQI